MSEQYHCSSCQSDLQQQQFKDHFKSEFHLYNIKRKVLKLSPVTYEIFQERFQKEYQNKRAKFQVAAKVAHACEVCKQKKQKYLVQYISKQFTSEQTYDQHLQSSKHKENLKDSLKNKESQQLIKTESVTSIISSLEDERVCIFCDIQTEDIQKCLQHMQFTHGFFIRAQDCLINLKGLLHALSEQININKTCLNCFQSFKSGSAVKDHMIDKGHCFMPQQEYKVLSRFYDFESKLQAMIDEQKTLIQESQIINQSEGVIQDESEEEEDEDWEDDAEEEEKKEDMNPKTDEERKQKLKQQLRELKQFKAILTKNGELLLPTGKILGTRLLKKYYKQNHIQFPEDIKQRMLKAPTQEGENQIVASNYFEKYLNKNKFQYDQDKMARNLRIELRYNLIRMRWLRKSC